MQRRPVRQAWGQYFPCRMEKEGKAGTTGWEEVGWSWARAVRSWERGTQQREDGAKERGVRVKGPEAWPEQGGLGAGCRPGCWRVAVEQAARRLGALGPWAVAWACCAADLGAGVEAWAAWRKGMRVAG